MPKILIVSTCLLALFFMFCDEPKNANSAQPAKDTITQLTPPKIYEIDYDSLFTLILELQNSIERDPTNSVIIKQLLSAAYDTVENIYYCVGKGSANPKLPVATRYAGMRQAAQGTAQRWSLYLKSWQKSGSYKFGQKISGTIEQGSKMLLEKMESDTLYQLFYINSNAVSVL